MRLEGTYTATVDRVVEGQAVLLVESDGETVAERHLPASDLPESAGEGAVLSLTFDDDDLAGVEYRPETTADRRREMRERFDRLSRRLGDDGESEDDGSREGADSRDAGGFEDEDGLEEEDGT